MHSCKQVSCLDLGQEKAGEIEMMQDCTQKSTIHDPLQNERYQSWLAAVRLTIHSPA